MVRTLLPSRGAAARPRLAATAADESSAPAGNPSPRRMRRAAEIREAARATFLEKGFAGSTISEIAAKVGVVEGLVYSYYPSKRDLLNAVLSGMYVPLIQDIEEGFSRLQGVRSRLRFLIWRHLRVYVEEPDLSRLVLHEVRTGPEYFKSVLHDLHVRYTSFLLKTVEDGIAQGELRADVDAEMLRSLVYGGVEHRMWGTLWGRGRVDVESMANRFTDMLLGPIQTQAPIPGPAPAPQASASPPADVMQALAQVQERLARIEKHLAPAAASVPAASPARKARQKDSR